MLDIRDPLVKYLLMVCFISPRLTLWSVGTTNPPISESIGAAALAKDLRMLALHKLVDGREVLGLVDHFGNTPTVDDINPA